MEVTPEHKIQIARALRQRQTDSEARLWGVLRNGALDNLKFRRQRPIGRFVTDFCCEEVKLIVEIDGGYHDNPQQKEFDVEREAHFTGRGYTVLRFPVDAVMTDVRPILQHIRQTAATLRLPCEADEEPVAGTPLPRRERGRG